MRRKTRAVGARGRECCGIIEGEVKSDAVIFGFVVFSGNRENRDDELECMARTVEEGGKQVRTKGVNGMRIGDERIDSVCEWECVNHLIASFGLW